jgi:hypothetical protein
MKIASLPGACPQWMLRILALRIRLFTAMLAGLVNLLLMTSTTFLFSDISFVLIEIPSGLVMIEHDSYLPDIRMCGLQVIRSKV